MNTEDAVRDALVARAAQVEPSRDAYAQLAGRLQRPRRTSWRPARLAWAASAAVLGVVVIAIATTRSPDQGTDRGQAVATSTETAAVATPTALLPDHADALWPLSEPAGGWPSTPEGAIEDLWTAAFGTTDAQIRQTNAGYEVLRVDESGQPVQSSPPAAVAELVAVGDGWAVADLTNPQISLSGGSFETTESGFAYRPAGRAWAFEGHVTVQVFDAGGAVVAEGFVMGGGTELLPLSGSISLEGIEPGPATIVYSDRGGLGVPVWAAAERIVVPMH